MVCYKSTCLKKVTDLAEEKMFYLSFIFMDYCVESEFMLCSCIH